MGAINILSSRAMFDSYDAHTVVLISQKFSKAKLHTLLWSRYFSNSKEANDSECPTKVL